MPRYIVATLKLIAIVFTPIAVIGFVISKQEISGDQYVAVLEIFGNESQPGVIKVFGADIHTISTLIKFFGNWSLPALVVFIFLEIAGLTISKNKFDSAWHMSLGLFFSFGVWAIFLSNGPQAFAKSIGTSVSDLSALVISVYVSELSAQLLSLTGLLALFFGALAMVFWFLANRRKVSATSALN
jgi:hypothetical protein